MCETTESEDEDNPGIMYNVCTPMSILSDYEIFTVLKRLASFMNRNNVASPSVQFLSRKLILKLKGASEMENIHECVYPTLSNIGRDYDTRYNTHSDSKLLDCLTQYFEFHANDTRMGTERHKCTRQECATYCILPMFARRCFSHRKVGEMYAILKSMVDNNAFLRATCNSTNESQSAINLLKYIASLGDSSLKETYDVLYAIAGHHGTIFNSASAVDSKLYELLFDMFRSYDLARESHRLSPDISNIPSLPLMDVDASQTLEEDVNGIEESHLVSRISRSESLNSESPPLSPPPITPGIGERAPSSSPHRTNSSLPLSSRSSSFRTGGSRPAPFRTGNNDASNADPNAPPSYHSLHHPNIVIPSAPVNQTIAVVPYMPPSYSSLQHDGSTTIVIFGTNSPSATQEESEVDDELPTYEQVLIEIVEQSEI